MYIKCPGEDAYFNRWSRSKRNYNFNQILASLVRRCWVLLKLKIHVVGGLEKGTQWVVSCSVIIPHLQVFLLPQSLFSLVKRKSICTDVYEWKIAQRRRKEEKRDILMEEGQWKLRIDGLLLVCVQGLFVCLFVCSPDWLQFVWRCIQERSTMKSVPLNWAHY